MSRKINRTPVWIAFAALMLLVIGLLLSAQRSAAFQSTPTPSLHGIVLFEDDFATYSGRWQQKETPKASVSYGEAALNLLVVSPGVWVWTVPDYQSPLRDYRVEVTATIQGGSADALVGVMLDYLDDEHFYAVLVTPQGVWQFGRYEETEWIDLTPPDAAPVERAANESAIRLRVEVVGSTVMLFIGDQLAGRVTVEEEMSGAVFGLTARAGRGYVDVVFDDFIVTALTGEES